MIVLPQMYFGLLTWTRSKSGTSHGNCPLSTSSPLIEKRLRTPFRGLPQDLRGKVGWLRFGCYGVNLTILNLRARCGRRWSHGCTPGVWPNQRSRSSGRVVPLWSQQRLQLGLGLKTSFQLNRMLTVLVLVLDKAVQLLRVQRVFQIDVGYYTTLGTIARADRLSIECDSKNRR